jgi:hypothetical protein
MDTLILAIVFLRVVRGGGAPFKTTGRHPLDRYLPVRATFVTRAANIGFLSARGGRDAGRGEGVRRLACSFRGRTDIWLM